jgi:hypothetical protein
MKILLPEEYWREYFKCDEIEVEKYIDLRSSGYVIFSK